MQEGQTMTSNELKPAAQYLRMSTEHQTYSLLNQAANIERYAKANGFEIVKTYSDAAKSGLVLKHRTGLRQLLQDVVSKNQPYVAVIVYDVSRWGRFQDIDEAAHYEFICKSAGIPVHYSAEMFANDASMPSLIMKALRRTMAGEYSRELGVKVFDGLKRIAQLGFKQGGAPGYGLRRMLLSSDGKRKQQLEFGERKSIVTERVILVHGPQNEIDVVREIYERFTIKRQSIPDIAKELNRRRIPCCTTDWKYYNVHKILSHPKYTGCNVFGRSSMKLYSPKINIPRDQWVTTPGAYEPIVDQPTFDKAQRILRGFTCSKSKEQLLDELRALLAQEGTLTTGLIERSPLVASATTYRHRFCGLRRAYELVGYTMRGLKTVGSLEETLRLRSELIQNILAVAPKGTSLVRRGRRRSQLRLRNGRLISVIPCRAKVRRDESVVWRINAADRSRSGSHHLTLLALFDPNNTFIQDLYLVSGFSARLRFYVGRGDRLFSESTKLAHMFQFFNVIENMKHRKSR